VQSNRSSPDVKGEGLDAANRSRLEGGAPMALVSIECQESDREGAVGHQGAAEKLLAPLIHRT
jgi:hypothetical protein